MGVRDDAKSCHRRAIGSAALAHRVVGIDEKLIERESARRCLRDARRQAKDAIGHLVGIGLHGVLYHSLPFE